MKTPRPLRVVQVVDTLDAGGFERVAVDIANSLPALGTDSFLCTTRRTGILRDQLADEVVYFSLDRKSRFDLGAIIRFRTWIKSNAIDIVHAHGNSSAKFCAIALLGVSSVIIHHDHNPLLHLRRSWMEKLILGYRVAAWICVSRQIHFWVSDRVKYKGAIFLSNPVKEARFKGKREFSLGRAIFVHLANFKPHKDHKNLIAAVRSVLQYRSDFVVECYGGNYDSLYRQEVDQLIERSGIGDYVKLNESVSDVAPILLKSQIGLLSSNDEGLPISLLEYLASGLPVIVTNVGECGDIVGRSRAGILVEPSRPEELALGMRQMLDAAHLWEDFGSCGMTYIHEHHSVDDYMRRIQEIYMTIA